MNEMDTIYRIIDGYADEVIRLQRGLTSLPALGPANGGIGEHEKAEYVSDWSTVSDTALSRMNSA